MKNEKFPVFFPVDREFGDEFAADCLHRQNTTGPFRGLSYFCRGGLGFRTLFDSSSGAAAFEDAKRPSHPLRHFLLAKNHSSTRLGTIPVVILYQIRYSSSPIWILNGLATLMTWSVGTVNLFGNRLVLNLDYFSLEQDRFTLDC